MNATLKMTRTSRHITLFVSAALASAMLLAAAGCETPDHRMSVTDLQVRERQLAAAAIPEVADEQTLANAEIMLDTAMGPYRLGPGDILAVTVSALGADAPATPIPVRVDRNGQIQLPTVGAVAVGGMELEDAEDAIQNAYVPGVFTDSSIHVALSEPHATRVIVNGAVALPSVVSLPRTERNVIFAINNAGGMLESSAGRVTVRRVRRPTEEVVLDIRNPHGLAAALALDPLQDGDLVRVHAAMPNMVFVGGLVNAPLPQTYPYGVNINVLQALAGAGGLRQDVIPLEATLVRRLSDGTDAHVKLDLTRIWSGEDANIELAAGDVLWVPHTLETRIQEFLNKNLFLRAGAVVTYEVSGFEDLHSRFDSRNGGNLEDTFDPFNFIGP